MLCAVDVAFFTLNHPGLVSIQYLLLPRHQSLYSSGQLNNFFWTFQPIFVELERVASRRKITPGDQILWMNTHGQHGRILLAGAGCDVRILLVYCIDCMRNSLRFFVFFREDWDAGVAHHQKKGVFPDVLSHIPT